MNLTPSDVLSRVDHTLLAPAASEADIRTLCEEALAFRTASVCINPKYVSFAYGILKGCIPVCTVVGFPLGASTARIKALEAAEAVGNGAAEADMVISIGDVKDGRFDRIEDEIREVKKAVGPKILKVIVETCLLTEEEKRRLCHAVLDAGADFIKTSTGFSTGGATLEDIKLFFEEIGGRLSIKAAGGIKTDEDIARRIEAGADGLGSSSAVRIIQKLPADGQY